MYPPLSGLFDSRPVTCVPTATIEGWKSDPGRYFVRVPIVFSFFPPLFFPPTRLEERSTFRFSFLSLFFSSFVPCFARETFEIHRLLSMKIDFELCANYSFFFCEKFEKFKKRFFESIFHPYNIWISKYYENIFRFSVEEICWKVFFLRNR